MIGDTATHFVGFRGDAYLRAAHLFGVPDYIHIRWDARARREIGTGVRIIFAGGDERQPLSRFTGPDVIEESGDGRGMHAYAIDRRGGPSVPQFVAMVQRPFGKAGQGHIDAASIRLRPLALAA